MIEFLNGLAPGDLSNLVNGALMFLWLVFLITGFGWTLGAEAARGIFDLVEHLGALWAKRLVRSRRLAKQKLENRTLLKKVIHTKG